MSAAAGFALLSLLFAGVHDVVFKRYALKERSRGTYVFGIGIVWGVLQLGLLLATGGSLDLSATTLRYGLAAGLLLTASNIALLESLTHMDAGLGSMVYRLNTVGVVILSVLLLGEPLGAWKAMGITLGLAAIFLLYRPGGAGHDRRFALFFALAVFASLCRAIYGVVSKSGLAHGAGLQTMLVIAALSWVAGGALYAVAREGRFRMTGKKASYALLSGLLVFLIVNFLLRAIEGGDASVVIPMANMSFVLALMLSTALGMERITARKVVAVGVSIGSLLILARV